MSIYFDNDVYLCIQKTPFQNFKCRKFNSFIEADMYYIHEYDQSKKYERSTLMPINKYTPNILRKSILNYKLRNLFWEKNIALVEKL